MSFLEQVSAQLFHSNPSFVQPREMVWRRRVEYWTESWKYLSEVWESYFTCILIFLLVVMISWFAYKISKKNTTHNLWTTDTVTAKKTLTKSIFLISLIPFVWLTLVFAAFRYGYIWVYDSQVLNNIYIVFLVSCGITIISGLVVLLQKFFWLTTVFLHSIFTTSSLSLNRFLWIIWWCIGICLIVLYIVPKSNNVYHCVRAWRIYGMRWCIPNSEARECNRSTLCDRWYCEQTDPKSSWKCVEIKQPGKKYLEKFTWISEPSCEACKPIIYLYPEQEQDITVLLDYQGEIFADYPEYDEQLWWRSVTASPEGTLINHADNREYSYLFWEGRLDEPTDWNINSWYVIPWEDTIHFLQDILPKIWLTPREYNEFIVYWFPLMQDNPYNLIHFAQEQYTDTAILRTIPQADSMLRVFMVWKWIDEYYDIPPQDFEPFYRQWLTVVERGWGEIIDS